MLDLSNLTIGEMAMIEDLGGQPLSALGDTTRPQMKTLAAVAMIVKRRSGEPTFTWNAAMDLTMSEINELLGLNEPAPDEDSEEGKDERSVTSAPKSKPRSSSTSASRRTSTSA